MNAQNTHRAPYNRKKKRALGTCFKGLLSIIYPLDTHNSKLKVIPCDALSLPSNRSICATHDRQTQLITHIRQT